MESPGLESDSSTGTAYEPEGSRSLQDLLSQAADGMRFKPERQVIQVTFKSTSSLKNINQRADAVSRPA
jgi:hypothetical protein